MMNFPEYSENTLGKGELHVMLVDPDAQTRVWLRALLSEGVNAGSVSVVECGGSAEALSEARRGDVDLVIAELELGQGDGIELIRGLARMGYPGGLILASGSAPGVLAAAGRLARTHGLHLLAVTGKPLMPAKVRKALLNCAKDPPPRPGHAWTKGELDLAFEAKQFVNFYQPQVELRSGSVMSMEMLVRWQHPKLGLLPASDFIHEVETQDRTDELLLVTLPRALGDASAWRERGLMASLAINVSPLTLRNIALPDLLEAEAGVSGFPLDQLVIEVTERYPLDDPGTQLDTLLRMRLKRMAISMDDFGRGHASIESLRRFPFSELKLDRSLLRGARQDLSIRAVMEASLSTARRLGLRTVAEGAEDPADIPFLDVVGCDAAQGNLVAQPMPHAKAADWLRARPDLAAGLYRAPMRATSF